MSYEREFFAQLARKKHMFLTVKPSVGPFVAIGHGHKAFSNDVSGIMHLTIRHVW